MKSDTSEQETQQTGMISVVIPTRDGAATVRELLAGLAIQRTRPDEILVVDSASTDDTVAVAEQYGAVVHRLEPGTFDHGTTRNLAATMVRGEFLLFFTQDALPKNPRLIERLVAPLINDPGIAMSYGRQLPAFNADDIAAHLRLFNYPAESSIRSFADRHGYGLATIFASNSCAAYRRRPLTEAGCFPDGLIFGEDTFVAGRLLERGYKIAYVADAEIYHSHNYRWEEEFRRYFDIGVLHRRESWLLQTYGGTAGRGLRYLRSGLSYLGQRRRYSAIGDFMVRVALKWIGYQLGRRYRFLPRRMAAKLSLNRNWWNRRLSD